MALRAWARTVGDRRVIISVLDKEAQTYAGRAVLIILPALAVIAAVYIWWHRRRVAQRSAE